MYHFFAFGNFWMNGYIVARTAPYAGTDQRNVYGLQSLPVISSAPTLVQNSACLSLTTCAIASATALDAQPAKKRAPSCSYASVACCWPTSGFVWSSRVMYLMA
ncbi:MAG: hypothetical protein QOJ39_3924 [Candidatus Eremiobacteraeota bacterium]|nr:hypothetical protein [Candidatus Eremiobacteraeota bacterium]